MLCTSLGDAAGSPAFARWVRCARLLAVAAHGAVSGVVPGRPRARPGSGATASAAGDWLHRRLYEGIGLLPPQAAQRVRGGFFDTLFAVAPDPWNYADRPYELRKREALLRQVPPDAGVVVELGCADGHNLRELGTRMPGSRVMGLDISARAVAGARRRVADVPNVRVLRGSVAGAGRVLDAAGVHEVDVLVVAETLYYLGAPSVATSESAGLARVLAPGARIVLLHPPSDARRFHEPVLRALRAEPVTHDAFADQERPFVIDVGVVGDRCDAA